MVSVSVKTNVSTNYKINAQLANCNALEEDTIKAGDLLKFISINDRKYVTNVLDIDDPVECIARLGNFNSNVIPVYLLRFKSRYTDMAIPYININCTYDKLCTTFVGSVLI